MLQEQSLCHRTMIIKAGDMRPCWTRVDYSWLKAGWEDYHTGQRLETLSRISFCVVAGKMDLLGPPTAGLSRFGSRRGAMGSVT